MVCVVMNRESSGASFASSIDSGGGFYYSSDGGSTFKQATLASGVQQVSDFVIHHVATGLIRTQPHHVRLRMWFFEGRNNDVVQVCVDNTQCVVGHSWEDYYRYDPEQLGNGNQVPDVSKLLFREGGVPAPLNLGNGYLVDDVALASVPQHHH